MSKQCCYCQRRVSQCLLTSKQREFDHFEISKKIFLSFKKELTHLINNTCLITLDYDQLKRHGDMKRTM